MTTNNALISRSAIDRIIRCNAHAGRASWIKNDRPQALAAAMLRDEDQQAAQSRSMVSITAISPRPLMKALRMSSNGGSKKLTIAIAR